MNILVFDFVDLVGVVVVLHFSPHSYDLDRLKDLAF